MQSRHAAGGYSLAGYLRTGRLIRTDARWGAREVKFNPHHDPKDGRFTFKDAGGSADMSRPPKVPARQAGQEDPRIVADDKARAARDWARSVQNPHNHLHCQRRQQGLEFRKQEQKMTVRPLHEIMSDIANATLTLVQPCLHCNYSMWSSRRV